MKQYEIKLNKKEKSLFVSAISKKLKEKDMTVYELADKMGKPVKSIYNFMSSKSSSRFLAAELADFLNIDKSEYRVKSSFFSALIGIGLGTFISAMAILSNEKNFEVVQAKPIDFEKYIEERDIETDVFGVDSGTDFTHGYYEYVFEPDFDIPLEPEVQESIFNICDEYGICYELVLAMAEKESSFQPTAKNGNCLGLLQVNGKIHKDRMDRLGVTDLYDPVQNALVAVDYLSELFEQDGDVSLVLMKYNMSHKKADEIYDSGDMTEYADNILERSAELERKHGK